MTPLFKVVYRGYRIIWWLKQGLHRRLTRPGMVVALACLASVAIGLDTENTVAYQAFALLIGFLVVAGSLAPFFKIHLSAVRVTPRLGTVGHSVKYRVLLSNTGNRGELGLTVLDELAGGYPGFSEWLAVQLDNEKRSRSFRFSRFRHRNPFKPASLTPGESPPIGPGQQTEVQLELVPLRRGLLRFAGLTLGRPDPLGLIRATAFVPLPHTLVVLPKRYPLPNIALPGTMKYQEGGVALASKVGQSEDFVALRDYRRGDPLRHIHWRTWAKAGKPVVKEFEDEFFVRHALVLDTFTHSLHGDVFEEAVAVAASFACTIDTQESLLDLLLVGPHAYCFTAGRGLAHADQLLEVLAAVSPCRDQPFASLETLLLNHVSSVSGCICVFLNWDLPRRQLVEKLRALGVPALVLVVREPGADSLQPGPMADDPERFCVLELGQIQAGLARLK